jgi:hypothetical protein
LGNKGEKDKGIRGRRGGKSCFAGRRERELNLNICPKYA